MAASFMESGYWVVAGWTMLHFLWVGVVIGLLAGVGRLVLASASPSVRYALALACLAALSVSPLIIILMVSAEGAPQIAGSGFIAAVWPDDTFEEDVAMVPDRATGRSQRDVDVDVRPALLSRAMVILDAAACYLPWAWLTGSPLVFMLTATGLVGAERLRCRCRLLDQGAAPRVCQRLLLSLNMARRVAVGVCDRVRSPVLIGILRPVILLPPAAVMGWSVDQLEMVLLHELAHVRRWDNLVNLTQRIVESLLFFHPAVWLVSRWVRREREHCCDQAVLAYTHRPRAYAEMLAAMVAPAPRNLALVSMGEASVVTRIRRVLRLEDEAMKLSHKVVGLLMLAFVATAILIGASALPKVTAHGVEATGLSFGNKHTSTLEHTSILAHGTVPVLSEVLAIPTRPSVPRNGAEVKREIAEADLQDAVILRLVDSEGNPVEGANVALRARWTNGKPTFFLRPNEFLDLKSGEDGRVRLPWDWFRDQGNAPAGIPVLAMHVGRELSGVTMVTPADHDRELTLRLQPPCHVRFRLSSTSLRDMGFPLIQAKGHIMVQEYGVSQLFEQVKDQPLGNGEPYDFEYLLPPGKYRTWAFGDADGRPETEHVAIPFEVKEGQEQLDLGTIDLPPTLYSLFYGEPAPEFVQVRDLRINTPLTLADLRGKVVLVHFSLTSGDPVRNISCPDYDVQGLYEAYKQSGLEVVVLRSPGGNPSATEHGMMDARFVEAVDSGGLTQIEGTSRSVLGATAAAYGVENAGLVLLIDREGRLVQRIRPQRSDTRPLLERELGLR